MTDPNVYRGTPPGPRPVPEGTPVYTPYIWGVVFAPLLTLLTLAFWDIDNYMSQVFDVSQAGSIVPSYLFDPGYLALQAIGFVVWLGSVLLAWLDYRELLRRGFERPFHWAWTFLGGLVYAIGRSIIVRRRAGRGYAPMWVAIALSVLSFIVVTWVLTVATIDAMSGLSFAP